MNLPFNLRELRCFVVVAEEGQITTAAARLQMAQPGLSQAIAKLESRLRANLLERHTRGVRLTAAGEEFLDSARAVLAATEEAISAVQPWVRGEDTLSLGFPPSAQALARPLRRRFMERHPGVEIEVRHLNDAERLTDLRAGRIDVELLYSPPPGEAGILTRTVLSAPRYAVLSEHHRLAGERQLRFEQIAGEPLSGGAHGIPEEWSGPGLLCGHRSSEPPVTAETPLELDQLWTLIYSGRAIAVLPGFMLSATVGDGVRAIPLLDVEPVEVLLARRRADRREVVGALFDGPEEPDAPGLLPSPGHPVAA
jgi:DNA-binding transcriptional LysR family regulator